MSQIEDILREIRAKLPDLPIKEQESMKLHTSFRIGGPCDAMVLPRSSEELRAVLALRPRESVTVTVIVRLPAVLSALVVKDEPE